MKWIFALIGCLMLGGVTTLILKEPSDADHAAATPRAMLMALRDPSGTGPLDGQRFDTVMGLQGKPPELEDYVQFSHGLFMSRECTDRCNYPPSAYLVREVEGGTELSYEVDAKVGGKLAQLGSRIVNGFAKKMVDSFFDRFSQIVEEGTSPDEVEAE